jgi:hypothetical protein
LLSLDHQFVQYWTPVNVHGVEPVPSLKLRMQDIFFAE